MKLPISVLILTHDEEINLPDCLDSVSWSDDVVAFDSFSSDKTESIAREYGVRFIQREFDGYAKQRNAALQLEYKYDWIFMLDADERCTPELASEIEKVVLQKDNTVTLYRVRRKDMFMGRWIKHSSGYPTWFGRLFKTGRVTVKREINEEYHTDGTAAMLREHITHYPMNKGIDYWFERHNRYSAMEAKEMLSVSSKRLRLNGLSSSDPTIRRKNLKIFAYRMPFRPVIIFIYLYFIRLGFLDGKAGLTYSQMRMTYEKMIDIKVNTLKGKP